MLGMTLGKNLDPKQNFHRKLSLPLFSRQEGGGEMEQCAHSEIVSLTEDMSRSKGVSYSWMGMLNMIKMASKSIPFILNL